VVAPARNVARKNQPHIPCLAGSLAAEKYRSNLRVEQPENVETFENFFIASLFDYKLMLGMESKLPFLHPSKYSKNQQGSVRVI
jgi:hypothetical protein